MSTRAAGAWFASLVLAFLFQMPVHARQDFTVESFDAGGRSHILRYMPVDVNIALAAKEAIEQSISTYQPLFGSAGAANFSPAAIGFQIFVNVSSEMMEGGPATALQIDQSDVPSDVTLPTDAVLCEITVNNPVGLGSMAAIYLAHEMAHCYQEFYAVNTNGEVAAKWWVEGTAELLAVNAYPSLATQYLNYINTPSDYGQDFNKYLFDLDYSALYFWEFMAGQGLGSLQGVVNFIVNMPDIVDAATYAAYLQSAVGDLDTLFHNYALAVAQNALPYQPSFQKLIQYKDNVGTPPYEAPIGSRGFSINFFEFDNIIVPPDKKLTLEVNGLNEKGLRASIITQNGAIPLYEGAPLDLCPAPSTLYVVVSRAANSNAQVNAAIALTLSDTACDVTPQPLAELPACIVGIWNVTSLPSQITEVADFMFSPGDYQLAFEKTGAFSISANMTSVVSAGGSPVSAELKAGGTGALSVAPDASTANLYRVIDYVFALDPASRMTVNAGGQTMDVTQMFLGNTSGQLFPRMYYLRCVSSTQLEFSANLAGDLYLWGLQRVA